jgi:hypothetical protein
MYRGLGGFNGPRPSASGLPHGGGVDGLCMVRYLFGILWNDGGARMAGATRVPPKKHAPRVAEVNAGSRHQGEQIPMFVL